MRMKHNLITYMSGKDRIVKSYSLGEFHKKIFGDYAGVFENKNEAKFNTTYDLWIGKLHAINISTASVVKLKL